MRDRGTFDTIAYLKLITKKMRMKRIVLYTTSNCPHCQSAKQFLDKRGLTYRACDVATPRGRKELQALGARGVPVIKIGNTIIRGFQPKAMEEAL